MKLELRHDHNYIKWLSGIKTKVQQAQLKAAVKVNTELLMLYWDLGKDIVEKQARSQWGDGLIEQLSNDLSSEFPDMKGFSRTNLLYIRKWYLFYSEGFKKVPQAVGHMIYMVETKKEGDVETVDVQAKSQAALEYCKHTTEFTTSHKGKPWEYALLPHNVVMVNMGFNTLMNRFEMQMKEVFK